MDHRSTLRASGPDESSSSLEEDGSGGVDSCKPHWSPKRNARRHTFFVPAWGGGQTSDSEDEPEETHASHVDKFVTFRVLFIKTFTVFNRKFFWIEQFWVLLIVLMTLVGGCIVWSALPENAFNAVEQHIFRADVMQRRAELRQQQLTVVVFLTGFFTTTNYTRWRQMRTDGIERIWSSTGFLIMFLCSCKPRPNKKILNAVDRYARSSLMWLFLTQRGQTAKARTLLEHQLLHEDEAFMLEQMVGDSPFVSVCLWSWIAEIIQCLKQAGTIGSEPVASLVYSQVNEGRKGARVVLAQLMTPTPLSYVALIGFMAKLLCALEAVGFAFRLSLEVVKSARAGSVDWTESIVYWIMGLELIVISTFMNAVLIINRDLLDPFDGTKSAANFPMSAYNEDFGDEMASYMSLANSVPNWIHTDSVVQDDG